MPKVIEKRDEREAGAEMLVLDEIAREGARRMLMEALKAEAAEYVERYRSERDEHGHALVLRNGRAQVRKLTLGAGPWNLRRRGSMTAGVMSLGSASASPAISCRPTCAVHLRSARCLPILYLRGLSTGDFRPALEALLGEDAAGLSSTTIARLTADWEKEYTDFRQRDLSGRRQRLRPQTIGSGNARASGHPAFCAQANQYH
jgi:putative transposase